MRLLEVAVSCKVLLEKFVSQDAGLWWAIHSFANFHVDVTVKCFVMEAIAFNNFLREERERHFHIFILVKWCLEIHVLNDGAGNRAPLVLMVLFQTIFKETLSVVRVVSSNG